MNKRIVVRVILPILIVVEICFLFLTYKSFSNKDIVEIKEVYEVNKKIFAMYTEQEDGSYTEYTDSNYFPSNGYRINLEMSNCVDNKGNKVEGVISGTSNKITVSSNKTAFCYLYFQKSTNLYELCKESSNIDECITNNSSKIKYIEDIWNSTLEEDGYRYVGTNPDNYICFGTEDANECKSDTDKYMYRIIGIFEDSEGKQHLKLIKKEALNTAYAWHSDYQNDTDWQDSDLYKGINGDYFLNNTNYSYMQNSSWNGLIETWDYTATNTKTYQNYNSTNETPYGPSYYYTSTRAMYLHELNRSGKANETCYYSSSTTADCTVGEWKTTSEWDKSVVAEPKIGLMYASDYQLSLGESSLNYTGYSNYSTLKTGWMHLSNNDTAALSTTAVAPPNSYEWTMSRHGSIGGYYYALYVYSDGSVGAWYVYDARSVRPVFYLTADSVLSGGDGTSTNPYTIEKPKTALEKACEIYPDSESCLSSSDLWQSTLEDDGIRYVGTNPKNYICFGTTDKTTCTGDTDKYMYRIIGFFEDANGTQHMKLIKKEALNTSYKWNAVYNTDVAWDASDLYKGINGSYFLTDTTNYPYMAESTWTNKIATWDYTATNTKTYQNYNSTNGTPYGPHYYNTSTRAMYLHELNRSGKANETCYYNSSTTADCSVGVWDTVSAKIGLMYVNDYALSLGEVALTYKSSSNYTTMKGGWMHLSNNDTAALSTTETAPPRGHEWTMSRYGLSDSGYLAWTVVSDGSVHWYSVYDVLSVRPVFYLESDVKITGGEGTSSSPFIIG